MIELDWGEEILTLLSCLPDALLFLAELDEQEQQQN